jgi:RNA polymerase sigma factor (sigma-70 family)
MAITEAEVKVPCKICDYVLDNATPQDCRSDQQQATGKSDLSLARAIARECDRAILFLFDKWKVKWQRVAQARSRTSSDADEAYGEFVAALPRACARFTGVNKASLATYLESVLRMKCYDVIRKRLNSPIEESIDDPKIDTILAHTAVPLECRELFHKALTILDAELKPKERIIWHLRIEGVRQEAIAKLFGNTPAAVSQNVMKICRKLHEILSELAGGPNEFADCRAHFFNEAQRLVVAELE